MKITFYRQGHANNSSSSHSLIFTSKHQNISTDEEQEFGWHYFTCGTVDGKKNYLLSCLRDSFRRSLKFSYNYLSDVDHSLFTKFEKDVFNTWVDEYFSEFEFNTKLDTYVDHQSVFMFPTYRDASKGINKEFAKDLIRKLLEPGFVFLGGNDNDDRSHSLVDLHEENEFVNIWRTFKDAYTLSMVEFDVKTGEYVFSAGGNVGSLLKLKF